MFLSISPLIPMIILFIRRKNVPLAKFQSEFAAIVKFGEILVKSIYKMVLISFADLLDQSTAAFVIAVLHDLTITVGGWLVIFEIFHLYKFFMWFSSSKSSGFTESYFTCRIIA